MGSPDFSTMLVLGALVGLLFVAIGYGQLVWLQRQARGKKEGGKEEGERSSPLLTGLFWISLVVSAICFLQAVTSRVLPEQDAQLYGEDLFAVGPRPGLVATYETKNNLVHRDDLLIRFSGQDGEEGQHALRSRKQIL